MAIGLLARIKIFEEGLNRATEKRNEILHWIEEGISNHRNGEDQISLLLDLAENEVELYSGIVNRLREESDNS